MKIAPAISSFTSRTTAPSPPLTDGGRSATRARLSAISPPGSTTTRSSSRRSCSADMRVLLQFAFAATLAARSYSVDGVVVAVDAPARTMLVSHRPIANYMGAMMMPFRVQDARELTGLHPGARVTFRLTIAKGHSIASAIVRTGESTLPPAAKSLAIGDSLPDFHLTDSTGASVTPADLRGKVVAIDFIYT